MIFNPSAVEASWYGRTHLGLFQRLCLQTLSFIYAGMTAARRALFAQGWLRSVHLPVPVIVVGNLIVGGAGKTPLTLALAKQLRAAGWCPGIISRGYGRQVPGVRVVGQGDSPRYVGDEPLLYVAEGFPVYVGERRAEAGRRLLAANPSVNVLIADDGLQHYALYRDIEVVVFDQRGVGNGKLLPAGPLREPLSRLRNPKLKAWVQQGAKAPTWAAAYLPAFQMALVPGEVYAINHPAQRRALQSFAGQRVVAIAGMGHPERFFSMLRDHGIIVEAKALPDHHDFSAADLPRTALPVLMTQKDAVKCHEFSAGHDNCFVVPVTARIEPSLPVHDWLATSAVASTMENC